MSLRTFENFNLLISLVMCCFSLIYVVVHSLDHMEMLNRPLTISLVRVWKNQLSLMIHVMVCLNPIICFKNARMCFMSVVCCILACSKTCFLTRIHYCILLLKIFRLGYENAS